MTTKPTVCALVPRESGARDGLSQMCEVYDADTDAAYSFTVTALTSVYRSMASLPISRPQPDCL